MVYRVTENISLSKKEHKKLKKNSGESIKNVTKMLGNSPTGKQVLKHTKRGDSAIIRAKSKKLYVPLEKGTKPVDVSSKKDVIKIIKKDKKPDLVVKVQKQSKTTKVKKQYKNLPKDEKPKRKISNWQMHLKEGNYLTGKKPRSEEWKSAMKSAQKDYKSKSEISAATQG